MASERERMPDEPEPGGEDESFEQQADMGEDSGISMAEMSAESPASAAEAPTAAPETTPEPEKPEQGRAWQRGWRLFTSAIMILVFARAAQRVWRRLRRG